MMFQEQSQRQIISHPATQTIQWEAVSLPRLSDRNTCAQPLLPKYVQKCIGSQMLLTHLVEEKTKGR